MLILGLIPVIALILIAVVAVLMLHRLGRRKSSLQSSVDQRRQEVLRADQSNDDEFVAGIAEGRLSFAEARDQYRSDRAQLISTVANPADHWTLKHLNRELDNQLCKGIAGVQARSKKTFLLFALATLAIAVVAEATTYSLLAPEELPPGFNLPDRLPNRLTPPDPLRLPSTPTPLEDHPKETLSPSVLPPPARVPSPSQGDSTPGAMPSVPALANSQASFANHSPLWSNVP